MDRLSAICDEVVVAGGRPVEGRVIPVGARFVADAIAGQGPLAGLHAGLGAAAADFGLIVACDMPFLNPNLLAHMAELPRRYQALVPRTADGRWHPAHAVYSRACLPVAAELLAEGNSSMLRLMSRLKVRELSEEEMRRYDPEGLSLFNLNDPKDLERARAIARRPPLGESPR